MRKMDYDDWDLVVWRTASMIEAMEAKATRPIPVHHSSRVNQSSEGGERLGVEVFARN